MLHKEFEILVHNRLSSCVEVLCSKDKEYSSADDRFHNFKKAGRLKDQDPIQALDGMWLKHRVSSDDMVERMIADPLYVPDRGLVADKLGDSINYTLLLEGLIEDRRNKLEGSE